jgi:23S rRNA (cytidine2498-2'-O)-methyltransferase
MHGVVMGDPRFLFVCSQPGAEPALKQELATTQPEWRFAFSRPGFLTFKWLAARQPGDRIQLRSAFARTYGWSLGPVVGASAESRAQDAARRLAEQEIKQLHVWQRQSRAPSSGLPRITSPQTEASARLIHSALTQVPAFADVPLNQPAARGQRVGDCIVLGPDQWWLGWHQATSFGQRWPGGVPQIPLPPRMISRAYLKLQEALLWSELPCQAGDRCIDLGSAPGGASQALLERGLYVVGVDPAEMHADILAHPHFIHLRKRGAQVRRLAFRGCRWLFADANVAPKHTLDTVESIVTHEATNVQGLLLTLKLANWTVAQRLPEFVERVKSWGYEDVRCRQLACNHQEVCLAALRTRTLRRTRRRRAAGTGPNRLSPRPSVGRAESPSSGPLGVDSGMDQLRSDLRSLCPDA